ncbi:hydrogenase maturation protease [Amycolatopsis mongoliensis]|uniref:Hydrogenase maturation protease n=1 Tax=Amycolatopsis mongoliensis TaxID=715475 RepID=A0A9Y2NG71_9PSEU|nr:hydrogenase maturation protease [Amycolatopsis sp. 4-36]WIY00494.1 hydrogenase maturation protease [Amycolatopsis sp. 4-36]
MTAPAPVLVLGIGNELLGDDGVGVVAARRLAPLLPPGVEVLDGSTLGLLLTPLLADRAAVLVLDAVSERHGPPGSIVLLRDAEIRRGHGMRATAHDVGLVDALSAVELMGRAPRHLALAGLVTEAPVCRFGLGPVARDRLPDVLGTACEVLRGWGVPGIRHRPGAKGSRPGALAPSGNAFEV